MRRLPLCLTVPAASQFARALGTALKTRHAAGSPPPGHVELLDLMARALGHRNLQSLQAAHAGPPLAALPMDDLRAAPLRADEALIHALPEPPLALEDRPAPARLSDNAFGDPVTLRRGLINHRLMARTRDCAEYRKLKPQPDAETQALLQAWRQLCRNRSTPRVDREDSPRRHQAAAASAG